MITGALVTNSGTNYLFVFAYQIWRFFSVFFVVICLELHILYFAEEVNGLIPVGTVLNPGNLDRSKPEMFDRRYLMLSLTDMKLNGFNLEFSSLRKQYAPVRGIIVTMICETFRHIYNK